MNDLHLIDLDQSQTGYRHFITSWLYRGDGSTYIVDTGPANTAGDLIDTLRGLDVTRLDYILLTHIHLDHAGAAGHVAEAFPDAKVVCWPKAATHLIDPARLWAGSLQVLGETAVMFGEPLPIDEHRLVHPDTLAAHGITWLHTPGHAPHHVSYVHGDILYVGEAAGMTCPTSTGALYLRPATPPRFFLDVALDSLDRLMALDPRPERFVLAHYGAVADPSTFLDLARDQLVLWVDVLSGLRAEMGVEDWSAEFQSEALTALSVADPLFAAFADLDADLQTREHEYFRNTLEGILGHLAREA
ncbi:MBL fold metallo-hydrolase [bacterium]|nr:MBL fold metallo-hydrolase [bacterium]